MKSVLVCCTLALFTLTSTPQSFATTSDTTLPAAASSAPLAPIAPAAPDASNAHTVATYRGGSLTDTTLNQPVGVAVSGSSLSVYTACKDKGSVNNEDGTQQPAKKCSQDSFKSVSNWGQPYTVPTSAVKTITWEQYKHHRIVTGLIISLFFWPVGVPVMCTTLEKDFITVSWDNHGTSGTLEFQADKKQYRAVLDALSKASGVSVTSRAQ